MWRIQVTYSTTTISYQTYDTRVYESKEHKRNVGRHGKVGEWDGLGYFRPLKDIIVRWHIVYHAVFTKAAKSQGQL